MGTKLADKSFGRGRVCLPFALAVVVATGAVAGDALPLKAPRPVQLVPAARPALPLPHSRDAHKKPASMPPPALPGQVEEKPEPRPAGDDGPSSIQKPERTPD